MVKVSEIIKYLQTKLDPDYQLEVRDPNGDRVDKISNGCTISIDVWPDDVEVKVEL